MPTLSQLATFHNLSLCESNDSPGHVPLSRSAMGAYGEYLLCHLVPRQRSLLEVIMSVRLSVVAFGFKGSFAKFALPEFKTL